MVLDVDCGESWGLALDTLAVEPPAVVSGGDLSGFAVDSLVAAGGDPVHMAGLDVVVGGDS